MSSPMEAQIIDGICPGAEKEKVEGFISKILAVEEQLEAKKSASEAANLAMTRYKCESCGNKDQSLFSDDRKHGQITCTVCGVVTQDSKIHDGAWKRKFSGDVNPSFHGPSPDPRFSSGYNLRTAMSLGEFPFEKLIKYKCTPGGIGDSKGPGGGGRVTKKELRDLKYAQNFIEMNISNFGSDVKRTREGYKDKMKSEAFQVLDDVGFSLQLHESVIQRAKALFAGYRDMLEQVQSLKLVEAACIIAAYRDMLEKGQVVHKENTVSSSGPETGSGKEAESGNAAKKPRLDPFESLHPFACKYCERRFNNKKDLRLHVKYSCENRKKVKET